MRAIILIFILLALLIIAFPDQIELMLKPYPHILHLFPVLITAAATISALYFGLYGNRETKLAIRKKENDLDREAFNFLSDIRKKLPLTNHIPQEEQLKFISNFENIIIENAHLLSEKKQKKLHEYAELAKKYFNIKNTDLNDKGQQFEKIIKEAEYLQKNTVDNINRLQLMYEHADIFWNRHIYIITPLQLINNNSQILIYFEDIRINRSDVDNTKAYVDEDLKKQGVI